MDKTSKIQNVSASHGKIIDIKDYPL